MIHKEKRENLMIRRYYVLGFWLYEFTELSPNLLNLDDMNLLNKLLGLIRSQKGWISSNDIQPFWAFSLFIEKP